MDDANRLKLVGFNIELDGKFKLYFRTKTNCYVHIFDKTKMKSIIIFLLIFPVFVNAEIYKTIDENGRVIFTDKPTPKAEQVEVRTNENTADGLSGSAYTKAGEIKAKKPAKQKSVVMYSTAWCGYCAKARNYMQSKGIKYKEYDIEKSVSAKTKYKQLGGTGVPFFVIGGKTMGGFSAPRLEAMVW